MQCAAKNYKWGSGRHYKVHDGQIAQAKQPGADGKDWNTNFSEMMNAQV